MLVEGRNVAMVGSTIAVRLFSVLVRWILDHSRAAKRVRRIAVSLEAWRHIQSDVLGG